jgi:hypothetical protein
MAIKRIDYYGRFEPTPVDESTARRFQALAGLADTVSETALRIGERALEKRAVKAEKAGIEAGALAVGEAVKTGNLELRSGGTIYDESYNDALESAYLAQVSTDAKNEFTKLIAQAPDDTAAFNTLAEKAIAGIKTGVDPRYVDVIDSTLNNYLATAQTKVFAAEQAKNRRIANEARLEAIQSASVRAASLSREGNRQDAMAEVMEAEVTIDSMVATGDLSAEKAGELKRANRREVLEQDYKFQLDQKVEAEGYSAAFQALDKFERDKDFTPDEWAAFKSNAATELSRAKSIQDASQVAQEKQTQKAITDFENAVSLGVDVDPQEKARVQGLVEGTEYEARFNRINTVAAYSVMPTRDRNQVLQKAGEAAARLENTEDYAALLTAEQKIRERLNKDAFQFGVDQGLVDFKPFDYTDPNSLAERVSQADILAEHYGVQVSPLTEVEVSTLANGINNMTVDEKMALANTLSQAPTLWGELDKKNQKAFAMAGAIGDPDVMRAIFQGQELIKEKLVQVPPKTGEFGYLVPFEDYVQDVYGTDDKAAIMQAAIAHYSAVQIPGEAFDKDLFEESLKAVAGTMEEVNGFRTVMPRGVEPDQFETFIDNIDADYIESIGGVANMTTEMAVDVIKNSRLYATGENFYEVRVNGMQSLMKKDGTPLVISYTPEAAGGVSARDQARRRKAQEENLATIRALRGR